MRCPETYNKLGRDDGQDDRHSVKEVLYTILTRNFVTKNRFHAGNPEGLDIRMVPSVATENRVSALDRTGNCEDAWVYIYRPITVCFGHHRQ